MEDQTRKSFYTIGEVAEIFQVNTSLIRFWEKEFDVIRPHRNKKGNRLFTQKDVDNFHHIFRMVKEQGFTLQGAKEQLKSKPVEGQQATLGIAESLRRIKTLLLELKELC